LGHAESTRKWLVIAANGYKIRTARLRRIRRYLPYLIIGLLTLHVLFIAPWVVGLFVDDAVSLLLSTSALATVQLTLSIMFLYFIILPITETLREVKSGRLEILLATPIKPSDLLVGEYLGEIPFYAIVLSVLAAIFAAILRPVGLGLVQIAIVIIILIIISLAALWIGIVVAAVLRTRLERLAGGKDIGGAIAMIIPLPFIAIIYAAWGGNLLGMLSDPEASGILGTILRLLPSSWGSELVIDFAANPGDIAAVGLRVLTRLGSLIAFLLASLWLGARVADRAYSLEQTSIATSTAKPDGIIYRTVRKLGGGGSFGALFVSLVKDFGRHLQNISNIVYMLGIFTLVNVFIMPESGPDDPPISLLGGLFLYPILVVMVAGGITVDGKEKLFIFKKAPGGIWRLLKATALRGWLLMVPLTGGATAVMSFREPGATLFTAAASMGLVSVIVAADVLFVIGLFLVNPAFSEKSPRLWINVMIVMGSQIGLFVLALIILTGGGQAPDPVGGMPYLLLTHAVLGWLAGGALLLFGKRKLEGIE
jgi:hypothetical protein